MLRFGIFVGLMTVAFGVFAERPNVILVMTDDQGYGDFGATGNQLIRTPYLDAMAKRSATMTTFYVSAVCSPTRASLMTGRYNYRTRVIDTWLGRSMMEPGEVTVAEVLLDAGYATGIFGKWHLGDSYPMRAIDQGFEEALVHRGGGLGQPADHPDNDRRYTDPILYHNGVAVETKGYCTDIYFDAAKTFIRTKAAAKESFFAYVAMNAPHGPFHDVPEGLRETYATVPLEALSKKPIPEKRLAAEKDKLERIAAMITNVDDNMGELFSFLEDEGLTENTLVIFLTDNGPNTDRYAGPFRGMKSDVYDGGVRTPIWFQWPARLDAGTSSDALSAHIDLMPTILDACEVDMPKSLSIDGRSLLPILEGSDKAWPDRTITLQTHRGTQPMRYHHFMTRDSRWKLVHPSGFRHYGFEGEPNFELYDLENDPGEQKNVGATNPNIVARLKDEYDAWFDDVSSTRPDNYAPPTIQIGTPHENPTALTRQDWIAESWGQDATGYWNADFVGGAYAVTVHLYPMNKAGTVTLTIGEKSFSQEVDAHAREAHFSRLRIPAGRHRIQAVANFGARVTHANQLALKKL
jgi:arylsulfatase/arylsulfatase A